MVYDLWVCVVYGAGFWVAADGLMVGGLSCMVEC